MNQQTTERTFESHVKDLLIKQEGWLVGTNADWDPSRALFPARVFSFIEATQPRLWGDMGAMHGDKLKPMLLNALVN